MSAPATSGLITLSNGGETTPVALSYYQPFYQRVSQIGVMHSLGVLAESSTVDGHTARASKALQFLSTSASISAQVELTQVVLADTSIGLTSTSQAIADRIALVWSAISGA